MCLIQVESSGPFAVLSREPPGAWEQPWDWRRRPSPESPHLGVVEPTEKWLSLRFKLSSTFSL